MRPGSPGVTCRMCSASIVAATLLAWAAAGCATGDVRYPGRADARAGDRPIIWIDPTGSTETSPSVLRVGPGTEVTWRNRSQEVVFVRFNQAVTDVCGEPVRFDPSYDGASYVSRFLPPFADARLCFARPGRYDFVVSSLGTGGGGPSPMDGEGGDGLSPVRYGTVIVE